MNKKGCQTKYKIRGVLFIYNYSIIIIALFIYNYSSVIVLFIYNTVRISLTVLTGSN